MLTPWPRRSTVQCLDTKCVATVSTLGGACTADSQCPRGQNGYGSTCSLSTNSICGGEGSTCVMASQCAKDYTCEGGACTALKGGDQCSSTKPCTGNNKNKQCSSGLCGGSGATCTTSTGCATGCEFDVVEDCDRWPPMF